MHTIQYYGKQHDAYMGIRVIEYMLSSSCPTHKYPLQDRAFQTRVEGWAKRIYLLRLFRA